MNKLDVIIPAYNEEDTISEVIRGIRKVLGNSCRIIVIDDGSQDKTIQTATEAGAAAGETPILPGDWPDPQIGANDVEDATPIYIENDEQSVAFPSFSNNGYGTQTSEPLYDSGYDESDNRSAWWVYKPITTDSVTFSTDVRSDNNTAIAIYELTGSTEPFVWSNLTYLTGTGSGGTSSEAILNYTVTSGKTYYIQLGSYNNGLTAKDISGTIKNLQINYKTIHISCIGGYIYSTICFN